MTEAEDRGAAAQGRGAEDRGEGADDSFVAAERRQRLAKLEALRERGIEPYPPSYSRGETVGEVRERFGDLAAGAESGEEVNVAGRLMLIRRHGGLVFADLRDRTAKVQLMVSRRLLGDDAFGDFEQLDLGDWVGARGEVVSSEHGELSIRVAEWELLTKALRALPKEGHGPTDVDTRFRERYLDLIVNAQSRRIFEIRSHTIAAVREILTDRGFVEVETPVLDTAAGGAAARPFITHHNALDIDMFMRIALELPLKRLVVGGMERVFEIGRVFRNEGLDTRHNPEFTLLEAYQALADYHDMMELVEAIVAGAAQRAHGTTEIDLDGRRVDLAPPWRRAPMSELIREHAGVEMHPSMPLDEARAIAEENGIACEEEWGGGRIMSEVYDATCEAELVEPTFVLDHPREVSPLARTHRDDPDLVERFECVIGGRELANAYSELNDPVDQRQRFEAEAKLKAAGDEEAEDVDDDYIRALEFGLPPTGGLGIGLDRLVMLLAGASSIREVILFPTMKPEGGAVRPMHATPAAAMLPTPDSLAPAPATERPPAEPPAEAEPAPAEPRPVAVAPAAVDGRPRLPARRGRDPAFWLALATAIVAILSIVPTLPVIRTSFGLEPLFETSGVAVSHAAIVVAAIGLLFVSAQLARRKRRAWIVALVLLGASALIHLLKGPDPIAVVVSAAMLMALVWWRELFTAPGDPRSMLTAFRFAPVYVVAVGVFGFVSLLVERHKIEPDLTIGGMLETTYGGLIGLDGPYTYESRLFADFFPDALLALGIVGLLGLAVLLFRPLVGHPEPNAADRDRARALVRRWGSDTLAYFALHEEKSWFFSSDGEAMVPYAYAGGYALASADPIGAPDSVPRALDEFLAFCRGRAWHVAFLAVREEMMPTYEELGFHGVYLGDEAIIPCERFTLAGGAMKPVREAVRRVGRDHRFRLIRESDAPEQLIDELNEISRRWRAGAEERGFTMELTREVEGAEPDFLLALALDEDDRAVGFLRLVPCYGDDPGYSLDLMRRGPDAPNGLTEFLIANSALALGERGFHRLSMNFAAWGRLFEEGRTLGPGERLQRALALRLNRFFQVRSLRDFNEKFQPEWLPRSLAIEEPTALPRVGLLFATIEGFVTIPVVGHLLVPRVESDRSGSADGRPADAQPAAPTRPSSMG